MAFTCPACGGEFETQERLDEHTSGEHGQTKGSERSSFVCPACGGEFEAQETLEQHTRSAHVA